VDTTLDLVAPDDISEDYAPRPRMGFTAIGVGSELVVLDETTWEPHVLNATAALVWRYLDGESTLGELAEDFSEATGTDKAVVRDDILSLARELGRAGLL